MTLQFFPAHAIILVSPNPPPAKKTHAVQIAQATFVLRSVFNYSEQLPPNWINMEAIG